MDELTQGTRIYYSGDMANIEGFGHIRKVLLSKWGTNYNILMEDGREKNVSHSAFGPEYSGHCNPRFVTETAYNEYKQKQIKKFVGTLESADTGKPVDVYADENGLLTI